MLRAHVRAVIQALVVVSLLGINMPLKAEAIAPYIQYYSQALGGFVIERAEGQTLSTRITRATHTWDVGDIWRRYGYWAALD